MSIEAQVRKLILDSGLWQSSIQNQESRIPSVSDSTLLTISHCERQMFFGRVFVAEISEVSVLRLGQLSKYALLCFCSFFDPNIKFILCRMTHIPFLE